MAEFQIKTSENGKVQGPFSSGQLKKLVGQGKLRPEYLVSANGGASWHPATRVSGLEFPSPAPRPESTPPPMPPQPSEDGPDEQSVVQLSVSKRTLIVAGAAFGLLCVGVVVGVFLMAGGSDEPTDAGVTADATSDTSRSDNTSEKVILTTPVGKWRSKGKLLTVAPNQIGPNKDRDGNISYWDIASITHSGDTKLSTPPYEDISIFHIHLQGLSRGIPMAEMFVIKFMINTTANIAAVSFLDPDEYKKGIEKPLTPSTRYIPVSR